MKAKTTELFPERPDLTEEEMSEEVQIPEGERLEFTATAVIKVLERFDQMAGNGVLLISEDGMKKHCCHSKWHR